MRRAKEKETLNYLRKKVGSKRVSRKGSRSLESPFTTQKTQQQQLVGEKGKKKWGRQRLVNAEKGWYRTNN